MNTKRVSMLFNTLGIPPNFKGYPYLVYIVSSAAACECASPNMIDLYAEAGSHFHTAPRLIQDNIRTVLDNYWTKENAARFSSIIRYPVQDKLTIKEFVCVVARFIINRF